MLARAFLLLCLIAAGLVPEARAQELLARFMVTPADLAGELTPLFERILEGTRLTDPTDPEDDERLLRRLRNATLEGLTTEGFFAPRLAVEVDPEKKTRYVLRVEPGERAQVADVQLVLRGGIESQPQRVAELIAGWELAAGKPFRDAQWSAAKTRLLARVQERDFPAARLIGSEAEVDVATASVKLRVELDSGPAFTLGRLSITGLQRYDPQLVERYSPIAYGERYDADKLLEFQRRLQASPYFSRVSVDVDADPAQPENVPIRVELAEAQTKRVTLGAGYSTNTGPRVEATYRQALLFGYPYTLQSGVGVDGTRSVVFADILLPPKPDGALDSFGGLVERTDIEEVVTRRWAVGVARANSRESGAATYDTKLSLNFQRELRRQPVDGTIVTQTNDVVSTTYTWTRRSVDQITDPRRGAIMTASGTFGVRRSALDELIDQSFVRMYGRYVRYFPLSPRDQIILRGEAGHVVTDDPNFVPNEFLFRAGGAGSVRGYAYQSLGAKVGTATLGSRSMVVGSAEYVRWLSADWGAAVFYDVGDADDDLMRVTWARGYGLGARWRTLAGPLALDVAYGERDERWRVHFAIAIAF